MISGKKFVKFGRNTIVAVTCNFELLSKYQVDLVALLASFWMVGTLVKKRTASLRHEGLCNLKSST